MPNSRAQQSTKGATGGSNNTSEQQSVKGAIGGRNNTRLKQRKKGRLGGEANTSETQRIKGQKRPHEQVPAARACFLPSHLLLCCLGV